MMNNRQIAIAKHNANGNYATVADEFYFEAARDCYIHRLIIHISDTTGAQAQDYGNITGGLSNGYTIVEQDDTQTTLKDLCDGVAITTNGSIGRYCYDVELKSWGAGDEFIQARWTFAKAGYPLYLPAGHRLSITFNDDLSGLLEHYFMVQGYEKAA
jgi:hypothetical protein